MKFRKKTTATLLIAIFMISTFAVAVSLGQPTGVTLESDIGQLAELSTEEYLSGSNSVHLQTTGDLTGKEARIVIDMPDTFTLGDLETISWCTYLVAGSTAHVDVILDLNGDGEYGDLDDALVIQYAYNDYKHYLDHLYPKDPSYGALTGAWYQTFSDDDDGPAVIDGDAMAWATKGAPGPFDPNEPASLTDDFHFYSLAEWKAGITFIPPTYLVRTINAESRVLRLEIEVDNWGDNSEAYIDDVVINSLLYNFESSGPIDLTATVPAAVMSFTVDPTSITFPDVKPGKTVSSIETLTITNTGDYDFIITAELMEDTEGFYASSLKLDGTLVGSWVSETISITGELVPAISLTPPVDTPPGTYTGTLVFWAEATAYNPP